MGKQWYVAFGVSGGITRMTITADRSSAVQAAFAILDDGGDVREVGPMVEPPEGRIISADAIRQMWTLREVA